MTMSVLLVCCFISIIHLLNSNRQALIGSTVKLICPYKVTSSNVLRWDYTKEGSAPVYYAENTYINTRTLSPEVYNRLSISGNHTAGEYHLNIADVRKSDEGGYECSFRGSITNIMLTVIVGPTAVSLDNVTPDSKIPGIEGQNMTIRCTAVGGQPPPDIMIVILGSTYTGKQSAQHTLKPYSSDDGSTVTCQAGYTDINFFPFNTTAYIHLKLKPVIIPFASNTLSTEETKYFDVSCKSTGSRPAASMYWLLGQQNITSNSTSQAFEQSSTDKYTVASNLRYRVDRRYNGQTLKCRASNVAGNMESSLTLDVKYAPGVTVENKTFSQTQSSRQIPSIVDSNPPVSTCTWRHKSKYGELIRDFNDNNQILTLPTVPEDKRYQDTGEYFCTAENGIMGINGQLKQTGFGYVISNAPPVITADNKHNSTQYGKFGKRAKVYVNVYSIPKYSSISWYIVAPETPSDFTIIGSGETSITVQWNFGYDGGQTQTFYIEYCVTGTDVWLSQEIKTSNQLDTHNLYTLSGLQDKTSYQLRMYAKNKFNQSQYTDIETKQTLGKEGQTSSNAMIGTVAGVLVVLLIVCAVIISFLIFRKRKGKKETKKNTGFYENSGFQNVQIGDEYEEVVSKADTQEKQTSKTYEALRTKETVDVYDDLENSKGLPSSKSTSKTYESLGTKYAVETYDDLDHHKGLPSSKHSVDHCEALDSQDKPNVYEELENQKGQTEKVYVNEAF